MSHPAQILKQHNLAPLKKFGQNFLLSTHSLSCLSQALCKDVSSLEIGPGLGMVTSYLLQEGYPLHVCEIDRAFASYLQEKFSGRLLSLTQADFLKTETSVWQAKNIEQVTGNLPFYITTPVIQKTVSMPFVKRFVFGSQWEFAQRVCAGEGNSLAVFLNSIGKTELLVKIKRKAFYPPPSVDAAWFSWQRDPSFRHGKEMEKLLRAAFWGKRKSLYNALNKNPFWKKDEEAARWQKKSEQNKNFLPWLDALLQKRADDLSVQDYKRLLEFYLEL